MVTVERLEASSVTIVNPFERVVTDADEAFAGVGVRAGRLLFYQKECGM
jgi:hypothetical protein